MTPSTGRPRLLLVLTLLLTLLSPGPARAGQVAVLTDSRVAQYRTALTAAKAVLPTSQVLEVSAPDLAQQLAQATAAGTVLLAIGQKAMAQAHQSDAIVVFCMVLGPAAVSAKTVTGLRLEVSADVQLDFFRRVNPSIRRLGVLYNPQSWGEYVKAASRSASARGLTLVTKPLSDARELRSEVNELAGSIDALWLIPDPQLITAELFNFLLIFTLERRIALFGFFEDFTRAGALASVAPDYAAIGRQAAKLAADLAAKPVESRLPLPPSIASPGTLTINAKTAQQFGIDIPDDVQAQASQVYR